MEKLEANIIEKYWEARSVGSKYENAINNRVHHILRKVLPKAFSEFEIDWYDYPGGTEYYPGDLSNGLNEHSIDFEAEVKSYPKDKDEKEVVTDVLYQFSVEYLFQDDDEIIEELQAKAQILKDKRAKAKEKRKQAQIKKKLAKEQALLKLSKEERKALGIK